MNRGIIMNLQFLLAQVAGIIAWILLILSYYRKDTNKILKFQIIGTILHCVQYWLLEAWSGLFTCIFEIIFDYGYYKTNKDKFIYITSIPVRIIGGLIGYKSLIDILPILASLTDGYTLTKSKKIVVVGAVITYSMWVIYDIFVMSYSGAITDGLVVLSNLSIWLFNFNIFNHKEKSNNIG